MWMAICRCYLAIVYRVERQTNIVKINEIDMTDRALQQQQQPNQVRNSIMNAARSDEFAFFVVLCIFMHGDAIENIQFN